MGDRSAVSDQDSHVQEQQAEEDVELATTASFASLAPPSLEQRRQWAREELLQIPLLSPWTTYEAHDADFSVELNRELAQRVHEAVMDELVRLQTRLDKQQAQRQDSGLLSPRAIKALQESRLVVEAKRKVQPARIAENLKAAMRAVRLHTMAMRPESTETSTPGSSRPADGSKTAANSTFPNSIGPPKQTRLKASSVISPRVTAGSGVSVGVQDKRHRYNSVVSRSSSGEEYGSGRDVHSLRPLLRLQLPTRDTSAASDADNNEDGAEENENQRVTHFRARPVAVSAVKDAGVLVAKREPRPARVRYIMSTRLGVLPPTKGILEEYPIPKEVLDALERHRHFHVDASSPSSAFECLKLPAAAPVSDQEEATTTDVGGDWECFYQRSVPLERPPVSFVLESLGVAPERPLAAPSDLFHQQALAAAASDESLLLHEVRQLFDHTHDAHRSFRESLHCHLELQYLVDLSFRSALTSASYFVDSEQDENDAEQDAEPNVEIPTHLRRQRLSSSGGDAATATAAKWGLRPSGEQRMANRRGAIAVPVKNEAAARAQRSELLEKLCALTPQDVEFLTLWYGYNPDAEAEANAASEADDVEAGLGTGGARLDPVPMSPHWSARFELAWKQLALPTSERLDLAIKYASLVHSARLPDAVVLWETAGALIVEHEELLKLVRVALQVPKRPTAALIEDIAMLQALVTSATHVREALLLTYIEVGDFVTYQGNFYLAKMEHDGVEIRRMMEEGGGTGPAQPQQTTE